jgi:hypothetical protein
VEFHGPRAPYAAGLGSTSIKADCMAHKFAKATTSVGGDHGMTYQLLVNEVWDADDEIVKAHPEFFADEPVRLKTSGGWMPVVESATAAPGEWRRTR